MAVQRNEDGSKTVYCGNERLRYDGNGNITQRFVARTPEERVNLAFESGYASAQAYLKYKSEKDYVDIKTREQLARDAGVWDEETMGPPGL